MTTILVSNQPETLIQYASRICILNNGKIVALDSPQEFSKKVRFAEKLGVRHTQVAQVAGLLDEKGLWRGDYPLDESQAAEMIEKQFCGE